jgi:hypothetical protein
MPLEPENMKSLKKHLPLQSPQKNPKGYNAIYQEKKVDNKNLPACSYSQVVTNNPFGALYENEEEDVEMEDLDTDRNCDGSDTMPKTDNALKRFFRQIRVQQESITSYYLKD